MRKILIIFTFLLAFNSCKKSIDQNELENIQLANKFLSMDPNSDPSLTKIITDLKRRNISVIAGVAKNDGLPVWNKAAISSFSEAGNNEADYAPTTYVLLPLVKENASDVNAVINCQIKNNKISYQILRKKEYKRFPLIENEEMSASKVVSLIMTFEARIFNRNYFLINDGRLMKKPGTSYLDSTEKKIVYIRDSIIRTPQLIESYLYVECNEQYVMNFSGGGWDYKFFTCSNGRTFWTADRTPGSNGAGGVPPDPFQGGGGNGGGVYNPCSGGNGIIPGGDCPYGEVPYEYIYIEQDNSLSEPSVDIKKIFKCFDNLPDAGAVFSLTLCADVPVNAYPTASFSLSSGSPGHTFLIITKENNGQRITQAIGFYPNGTKKVDAITSAPSKIVNDKLHEINASITMNNIGVANFTTIRANAENIYSQNQYDLDQYNCANFAMDVFNSIRPSSQLIVPPLHVRTGSCLSCFFNIQKSPQMLFAKLKEMKDDNHSEAANIKIDQTNNYKAPLTNGECN